MSVVRGVVAVACVCAVWSAQPAEAEACSYESRSAYMSWPVPDGLRTDEPLAPLNTQIWLGLSHAVGDEPTISLVDGAGADVPHTVTQIQPTRQWGPQSRAVSLIPNAPLEAGSVYTVKVDFAELPGSGWDTDSWTFTTGSDELPAVDPSTDLEIAQVAFENLQVPLDSCRNEPADSLHFMRWRNPASIERYRVVLKLEDLAGDETIIVEEGTSDQTYRDGYGVIGTFGYQEVAYPCMSITFEDVAGRTFASSKSCTPSLCITPPSNDLASDAFQAFASAPASWDGMGMTCELAPDGGGDEEGGGCATAPASPIPHAPLALGGLALLGLLRNCRSKRLHA